MQNQLESKAYAGFFVRLIAYCIDVLIAALVVGMVKIPFSIAASSGADFLKSNFIFDYSFLDVLGYVGVAAYFVLLTYFAHTTVGKMLFHLEVNCDKEWTFINVLYRETIGRFLSSLLNIGYLAVIVQKEKQGFHDMLCDTHVVYKNMYERKKETESASVVTMDEVVNQGGAVLATVTGWAEMSGKTPMTETVTQAEGMLGNTVESEKMSMEEPVQSESDVLETGKRTVDATIMEDGLSKTVLTESVSEQLITVKASDTLKQEEKNSQEHSWTYYQPNQSEKE